MINLKIAQTDEDFLVSLVDDDGAVRKNPSDPAPVYVCSGSLPVELQSAWVELTTRIKQNVDQRDALENMVTLVTNVAARAHGLRVLSGTTKQSDTLPAFTSIPHEHLTSREGVTWARLAAKLELTTNEQTALEAMATLVINIAAHTRTTTILRAMSVNDNFARRNGLRTGGGPEARAMMRRVDRM